MRVIVTGGVGFVGSHTVELLKKCQCAVMILDDFSTGLMENISPILSERVCVENMDITNASLLELAFKDFRPDGVIHLAAQSAITTSLNNPVKDCTVNIIGTLNVIAACKKYSSGKLLFSSTSAVYREKKSLWKKLKETDAVLPDTPYGISKLAAEHYIQSLYPNYVILRYGNIYGPRQVPIGENQVVPRMIRHLRFGDKFYVHGSGNQKRDFIFVQDVARANVDALFNGHGIYNIASGNSASVNEIAKLVEAYYKISGYHWDHTDKEDPRGSVYMDVSKARDEFDWVAGTSLADGIRKTAEWWTANGTRNGRPVPIKHAIKA